MANLNLSEFTEKLFVADADHTFIWDSAMSISKRVSRNSWLNSGTLTSDAPVTISQTWNGTGSTVFKALVVNATTPGTTSSSSSLLLDLQVGGISQFRVTKGGAAYMTNLAPSGFLSFQNDSGQIYFGAGGDVQIIRDAANTLALRNGAAAQTFNVYGTSSASNANYARLALTCGLDGNATISTQALGTGTAGTISINGVPVGLGRLNFVTNLAIGVSALASNTLTTLGANVAVGDGSLTASTQTYWSTAIGYRALAGLTGFSNSNVAVGYEAGAQITSGANSQCSTSVFIGFNSKALGNNQNNQIVIGASAIGIGQNSVVLGNDSIEKTALKGNVGIGTTSPTSKLHVAGNASPSITVDNTLATGASQLLFKNTVVTGDTDGIFLNGSAQSGFGNAGSLNIRATTGSIAFHTASVTNALSIAQSGAATFSGNIVASSFYPGGILGLSHNGGAVTLGTGGWSTQHNGTRFTFSGLTDAFPAIERDGAGLKFTGAAAGSTSWIKVPPVAVSALPLAATAGAGARAFVNDASSPTFGSAVTGGGAVLVPVYSTGSAWHVG